MVLKSARLAKEGLDRVTWVVTLQRIIANGREEVEPRCDKFCQNNGKPSSMGEPWRCCRDAIMIPKHWLDSMRVQSGRHQTGLWYLGYIHHMGAMRRHEAMDIQEWNV
jgi:hypothetical protein